VIRLRNVVLDCLDPAALAVFWSAVLGYRLEREASDDRAAILVAPDGAPPRLYLQRVPEPKSVKNRVHLDLAADEAESEIARLIALGATCLRDVREPDDAFTVMADPAGNEFCVVALAEVEMDTAG
jgi:predicted enzyme related to lactoylglutathione lyase